MPNKKRGHYVARRANNQFWGTCECGKMIILTRKDAKKTIRKIGDSTLAIYRCGDFYHIGHSRRKQDMIKGVLGVNTNGPVILFGLSEENINRLQKGQPIKFNLREIPQTLGLLPDLDVVITYGKTENDIIRELKEAQGNQNG